MTATGTPTGKTDRLSMAVDEQLGTDSLVGSFFHGSDDNQVQGCIVAEPVPGIYLVELFEWLAGSSTHQELVPIADMRGWRFYDNSEWMVRSYENELSKRWERGSFEQKNPAHA